MASAKQMAARKRFAQLASSKTKSHPIGRMAAKRGGIKKKAKSKKK